MTLEAQGGLPTSPLELFSAVLVAGLLWVVGNWVMLLVVLAIIGLFGVIHRSKGTVRLTLNEHFLSYHVGKITRKIGWNDISEVKLKGNRLVGRVIRIRGPVSVEENGEIKAKRLAFDIANIFDPGIDQVFNMIQARQRAGAKR